jgi:hypothetical protein
MDHQVKPGDDELKNCGIMAQTPQGDCGAISEFQNLT